MGAKHAFWVFLFWCYKVQQKPKVLKIAEKGMIQSSEITQKFSFHTKNVANTTNTERLFNVRKF